MLPDGEYGWTYGWTGDSRLMVVDYFVWFYALLMKWYCLWDFAEWMYMVYKDWVCEALLYADRSSGFPASYYEMRGLQVRQQQWWNYEHIVLYLWTFILVAMDITLKHPLLTLFTPLCLWEENHRTFISPLLFTYITTSIT